MSAASQDLRTLFNIGVVGESSDGQLLERFAVHREEAAFEALVRRHGPMVWGVCRRLLRNPYDAEDAFQATFLVLARKAPAVARRELVGNWLYAVAYKTAVRARAVAFQRGERERQVAAMPEPASTADDRPDDLLPLLEQELSRLPEKYRKPVVLCELEGKTHREAAEQLGWPVGTVSARLSRAKTMLAKRWARRGTALSVGAAWAGRARAEVPAALATATTRAAVVQSAGAAPAGTVPASVLALVEGVVRTMWLSRLKVFGSAALAACILSAGVGVTLGQRTSSAPPQAPEAGGVTRPAGEREVVAARGEPAPAGPAGRSSMLMIRPGYYVNTNAILSVDDAGATMTVRYTSGETVSFDGKGEMAGVYRRWLGQAAYTPTEKTEVAR